MGCYDPDRDEYQSVCKCGTGFKDDELIKLTEVMNEHISPVRPSYYNAGGGNLEPDVWFHSSVVWEIQAADLSKSSVHTGAMGRIEGGRGIGLRFPRFLRIREDKKSHMATSAEQIADIYHSQAGIEGASINNDKDFEDFDDDDYGV